MVNEGIAAKDWYANSIAAIKSKYTTNWTLFARILAATSPLKNVKDNLRIAEKIYNFIGVSTDITDLLTGFDAHDFNIGRIIRGEALEGKKVKSFYLALLGDPNAVTVDRWIMRAFNLDRNPTKLDYDSISSIIRQLAVTYRTPQGKELSPAQIQACLWSAVRKRAGKVESLSFSDYLKP